MLQSTNGSQRHYFFSLDTLFMLVGCPNRVSATIKTLEHGRTADNINIPSAALLSTVGNPVTFCNCSYQHYWTLARFRFVKVCEIFEGTHRPRGAVYLSESSATASQPNASL